MNRFGKKIIAIALALMCMAVVGVVSASAATTDYWINRPYSSVPVLSGSHTSGAMEYDHIKGNRSLDQVRLNDSKNNPVVEFNDYSFATKDPKVHRTGGDTNFSVNTKNGSYSVGNFSVLYKHNNDNRSNVGGNSVYTFSSPKTGTHSFTPSVNFDFD